LFGRGSCFLSGQSGEGILSGSYSLTRIEPRSFSADYKSKVNHRESLATRDAAYEDALTRLPTEIENAPGRGAPASRRTQLTISDKEATGVLVADVLA